MTLLLQQLANGIVVGSTYALIAIGFGLTFSVMRVVNLAHPEFTMLATYGVVLLVAFLSLPPLLAGLIALVGLALLSLVLERSVLRPLRGGDILMPLLATAGLGQAVEYLVAGSLGAQTIAVPQLLPNFPIAIGGIRLQAAQVYIVVALVLCVSSISYYVRRTKWGRATRAIAERPDITGAFGINVNFVSQITIVLSTLIAGVGGLAIGNVYATTGPFIAQFYTLKSFIAMLVAGNRHIEAIVVVSLALGIVETLVTTYVSSSLKDVVAFVALLLALSFRPNGLFGSYSYA